MSKDLDRRERLLTLCLMAGICLTLAHFVHEAWYLREAASLSGHGPAFNNNFRYAPDAYRIAMPFLVPALQHAFGFSSPSVINGVLDFAFGFASLFLLYRLVVEELPRPEQRFAAVTAFLALVQFPFAWVVPYQRPETMPTAFYVSLTLYAASRRTLAGVWFLVLLGATAVQALLRTDVPLILGLAMILLSVRFAPSGSRGRSLLQGLTVIAVAGGIQAYLQFARFPHLSYPPDTPAFQLLNNFHRHNLGAATLALLPCLLPLLLMRRGSLRPVDALALCAATLYLPLWLTLGVAAEVRIYVPMLLAVCMVSARVLTDTFIARSTN